MTSSMGVYHATPHCDGRQRPSAHHQMRTDLERGHDSWCRKLRLLHSDSCSQSALGSHHASSCPSGPNSCHTYVRSHADCHASRLSAYPAGLVYATWTLTPVLAPLSHEQLLHGVARLDACCSIGRWSTRCEFREWSGIRVEGHIPV